MKGNLSWLAISILLVGVVGAEEKPPAPGGSCETCHAEMKEDDPEMAAPVFEWRTSIHHENGIACADCHGGNPKIEDEDAMDEEQGFVGAPEDEEIPDFCGKCHSAVRDNYMKSAHAEALFEDGSGPTCVDCHTAHKQQRASLDLINEDLCTECHEFDKPRRLKEAMRSIDQDLSAMEARIDRLFREGLDVESEQKALFALRNRAHRLTHVLDVDYILTKVGEIRTDLSALDGRVKAGEDVIQSRRRLGAFMIAFFLLGALLAHLFHKELTRDVKT